MYRCIMQIRRCSNRPAGAEGGDEASPARFARLLALAEAEEGPGGGGG